MKDSLSTFLQAQSLLALEESELPVATSATAFVMPRTAPAATYVHVPSATTSAVPSASGPSSRPWGHGKGRGKGAHYNNSWRGLRSWNNPWSGSFHMWPQSSSGILGARPGQPSFLGTTHATHSNSVAVPQPGYGFSDAPTTTVLSVLPLLFLQCPRIRSLWQVPSTP
jgi:hypothetical protein